MTVAGGVFAANIGHGLHNIKTAHAPHDYDCSWPLGAPPDPVVVAAPRAFSASNVANALVTLFLVAFPFLRRAFLTLPPPTPPPMVLPPIMFVGMLDGRPSTREVGLPPMAGVLPVLGMDAVRAVPAPVPAEAPAPAPTPAPAPAPTPAPAPAPALLALLRFAVAVPRAPLAMAASLVICPSDITASPGFFLRTFLPVRREWRLSVDRCRSTPPLGAGAGAAAGVPAAAL